MAEVKPEAVIVPKKGLGIGRVLSILAVVLLVVGLLAAAGVAVYLNAQLTETAGRLDRTKSDLNLAWNTLNKKVAALDATNATLAQTQADLKTAQDQVTSLTADLSTANASLKDLQDWKTIVVCEKTRDFTALSDTVATSQQLAAFYNSNYSLDVMKVSWALYEITISSDMNFSVTYLYDIAYMAGTSTAHKFVMAYNFGENGLQGVFSLDSGCWIDPPTKR
jgi:hypothetical protein